MRDMRQRVCLLSRAFSISLRRGHAITSSSNLSRTNLYDGSKSVARRRRRRSVGIARRFVNIPARFTIAARSTMTRLAGVWLILYITSCVNPAALLLHFLKRCGTRTSGMKTPCKQRHLRHVALPLFLVDAAIYAARAGRSLTIIHNLISIYLIHPSKVVTTNNYLFWKSNLSILYLEISSLSLLPPSGFL